jgi:hypothetical protein
MGRPDLVGFVELLPSFPFMARPDLVDSLSYCTTHSNRPGLQEACVSHGTRGCEKHRLPLFAFWKRGWRWRWHIIIEVIGGISFCCSLTFYVFFGDGQARPTEPGAYLRSDRNPPNIGRRLLQRHTGRRLLVPSGEYVSTPIVSFLTPSLVRVCNS